MGMMDRTSYETLENLIAKVAAAVRPPERLTVSEAATKHRKLNNPGSYVGDWKNDMTPYLVEPMDVLQSREFTGMAFAGPAQCGKALALDTPVPTPEGWTTMGEVKVGDLVIGTEGRPVRVIGVSEVFYGRDCYEVTFQNGEKVVADAQHNWACKSYRDGREGYKVRTTSQIIESNRAMVVPLAAGLDLPEQELPVDPYVLGAWLGDGHSCGARLYVSEADLADILAALGPGFRSHIDKKGLAVIALSPERHNPGTPGAAGVSAGLRSLGLSQGEEKRIPAMYLRASQAQRQALLQGLMDTDGTISKAGRCEFCAKGAGLAGDFEDLLATLGHSCRRRNRVIAGTVYHYVAFSPFEGEQVFRLARKQARSGAVTRRPVRQRQTAIVAINSAPSVPVRCIAVDAADHLYAVGRKMVMTHNTDMVLNWLIYSAVCDPADMMIVQTSNTTARDFSMRRIDRLHRHSPDIGEKLVQSKQADNVFDKHYQSGMMLTLSWPTINELSGKPIPRLWLTDYDRMDQNVDGEGSPFDLARKRATSFRSFGMCAAESSPGFVVDQPKWQPGTPHQAPPTQGILAIYNRGDRRRWRWRCVEPTCGETFEPDFKLLNYPDSDDPMEAAEMVTLRCPHCGTDYSHEPMDGLPGKHELNRGGRWVKEGQVWMPDGSMVGTGARSSIASFWMKGVAAAFSDWKTLVFNYLMALKEYENTGSEEALKTTVNTDQGDAYIPKTLESGRSAQELQARAFDFGMRVVPTQGRFLIASVDVQKNRFVVQVHAIAENGDIFVIDRFEVKHSKRRDPAKPDQVLWVNPGAHPEDWKLLVEEVMLRTYPLADGTGREMAIHLTVSDSGGKEGVTANAYNFVRWLRRPDAPPGPGQEAEEGQYQWEPGLFSRFLLLKGTGRPDHPRVRLDYPDSQRKDRNAGARGEIPVLFINTNTIKDMLNNRLDRTETGGRINFAHWLDENFYTELTVEVKDPRKGWVNPRHYRNESWDLLTYCIAATLSPKVNIEHIRPDSPPAWAERWDSNSLVFSPTEADKPFDAEKKPKYDLAALAAELG